MTGPLQGSATRGANRFLDRRLAVEAREPTQLTKWTGIQRQLRLGQDRNRDKHSRLFRPDRDDPVADVLSTDVGGITAAQPCELVNVEKDSRPFTLTL